MNAYPKFNIGFWADGAFIIKPYEKPKIMYSADLTSGTVLPSFLTLSRLSTATYFNNQGVLSDAVADTARFDYGYDGTNWINQGLLVEKQGTNYSKGTVGLNAVTASDSALSSITEQSKKAVRIREVSGNAEPRIQFSTHTVPINQVATFSIFSANLSPYQNLKSVIAGDSASVRFVSFNASGAVIGTIGGTNLLFYGSKLISQNYRRMFLSIAMTSTSQQFRAGTRNVDAVVVGDTSVGFDYDGIQVEIGLYPSSFIRQDANAAVTRAADNLQLNLSNYTGSIKIKYKRQDTEVVESTWLDLTNTTNPIISNSLSVGIWLQSIAVYNRILTAQEKSNV